MFFPHTSVGRRLGSLSGIVPPLAEARVSAVLMFFPHTSVGRRLGSLSGNLVFYVRRSIDRAVADAHGLVVASTPVAPVGALRCDGV